MAILLFRGSLCQVPLFMLAIWAPRKNNLDEFARRASRRRHRDWISMARKVAESFSLWLFFWSRGNWKTSESANVSRQLWGAHLFFKRNGKVDGSMNSHLLGVGFRYLLCSSLPGEMIQFDEHIFQSGWFNHQLEQDNSLPTSIFYGIC